eukprot:3084917-Pyramimonas_sp.AAC.1
MLDRASSGQRFVDGTVLRNEILDLGVRRASQRSTRLGEDFQGVPPGRVQEQTRDYEDRQPVRNRSRSPAAASEVAGQAQPMEADVGLALQGEE